MEYVIASGILFVASVLWIEANGRRAVLGPVRSSGSVRLAVRLGGWLLAAASLWLVAQPQGWERGIPIWLCCFSMAAFAALLVAAWFPKKHWQAGMVAVVLSIALGAVYFGGGAA